MAELEGFAHLGVLTEGTGIQEFALWLAPGAGVSVGVALCRLQPRRDDHQDFSEEQLDQSHLRTPAWRWAFFIGRCRSEPLLKDMLGERTFEDLKIPCALTAVDLVTEKEVRY